MLKRALDCCCCCCCCCCLLLFLSLLNHGAAVAEVVVSFSQLAEGGIVGVEACLMMMNCGDDGKKERDGN